MVFSLERPNFPPTPITKVEGVQVVESGAKRKVEKNLLSLRFPQNLNTHQVISLRYIGARNGERSFSNQWRIQGKGWGGCNPPFGTFSNLSGYPCLSLFHTKNNIMSYNMGFSPIDHYKKTVAIPLLDSLIIQMQDRFLTKISTPAICLV